MPDRHFLGGGELIVYEEEALSMFKVLRTGWSQRCLVVIYYAYIKPNNQKYIQVVAMSEESACLLVRKKLP